MLRLVLEALLLSFSTSDKVLVVCCDTRQTASILLCAVAVGLIPIGLLRADGFERTVKLSALLVTGEDLHHDWKATSPLLKEQLEQDRRLSVTFLDDLVKLSFTDLSSYHAVVIHFKNTSPDLLEFSSPDQHGTTCRTGLIRSRKATRCPVEVAYRQSVICHIANIVGDLGRRLRFDPKLARFVDDTEANSHPSVARSRRAGYNLPERI